MAGLSDINSDGTVMYLGCGTQTATSTTVPTTTEAPITSATTDAELYPAVVLFQTTVTPSQGSRGNKLKGASNKMTQTFLAYTATITGNDMHTFSVDPCAGVLASKTSVAKTKHQPATPAPWIKGKSVAFDAVGCTYYAPKQIATTSDDSWTQGAGSLYCPSNAAGQRTAYCSSFGWPVTSASSCDTKGDP